jgi:DNA-binding beta-propeller fold protein YncE
MSAAQHRAHHAKPSGPAAKKGKAVSFVAIIATKDRSVVRRIPVPGVVHHTAVTPDGRYAVVTHPDIGAISVIDLSRYSVVKTVKTGELPNYAAVTRDGKYVYVSNGGDSTVAEISVSDWKVRRVLAAGKNPEHMVLTADDRTLYVSNASEGTVSEIALSEDKLVRTFKIGGLLHGIDLSDDGKIVFVSGTEGNKVAAIDRNSGIIRSATLGPSPYHLAVIPGTGKIYVSSAEAAKVWVLDAETLGVVNEIPIRGKGHQMAVSQS